MKKDTIIKASFVIGFIMIILGAWLKILHNENADTFLVIGMIATIIYTVIALFEILHSNFSNSEKIMWFIGFLFVNTFTGLLYILMGRKRITRTHTSSV